MCGRYTLFVDQAEVEERFDAEFEEPFAPRYNAAPGQRLPILTNDEPETFQRLEWGLLPAWVDGDGDRLINARAETVAEKPSFREAYEGRRCLVPADGFYEWVDAGDGRKRPYRIAFVDDRPFAMAGLWERWEPNSTQTGLDAFGGGSTDADDPSNVRETFAILTTEPNEVVADLHHRMAVVLNPDAEQAWLDGEDSPEFFEPYPADDMHAYPVSRAVNDPSNDDPSVVRPVEP